jgi:hypothetical protein
LRDKSFVTKIVKTSRKEKRLNNSQGRSAEAEPLLTQVLAIREKVLGPEHPDVDTILEKYAVLLRRMGRAVDASPMETRARAIRSKQ